jgi:ribosomal protein S18 acetylase RimI-like enzyme
MYKINVKEKNAITFETGETFAAVANIDHINKTIDWFVPKYILHDFETFIKTGTVINFMDKNMLEKYTNWFIEKLSLDNELLDIVISINYKTKKKEYKINNDSLRYNQADTIDDCIENENTKFYKNKNEKAIAYIMDKKIIAIAHAENYGLISLKTLSEYRNKGYGTQCIKGLINEFEKENKRMYICTQIDNIAMRKVIEKLEVELTHYAYWVKIKK